MTVNINAFNEYDATGDASWQNFQPGQAYTLAITNTEQVVLGKGVDLAGAVFVVMNQTAGSTAVQNGTGIFAVSSDGTRVGVTGFTTDFVVDNDGDADIDLSAGNISCGVNAAGNLVIRSDDATALSLLIARIA